MRLARRKSRARIALAGVAGAAALALLAGVGPSAAQVSGHGFQGFCASWMEKLREREVRNERLSPIVHQGHHYVGQFTGYGRRPIRCQARPTGSKQTPFVGQLVYEEIVYRRQGKSPNDARASKPTVAGRIQVMEIFKFNGSRWVY